MPNRQFLLQMAGMPGAGKSALARLIGRGAQAVLLDQDVLTPAPLAGGADEPIRAGLGTGGGGRGGVWGGGRRWREGGRGGCEPSLCGTCNGA